MKIVVIGGTGLIGSKVVERLTREGHEAVAASPRTGVNALTGEGLEQALSGAQVVVDVSNSPSFERAEVMEFFETSTRNLLAAEAAAGVGHHVALSVVGTERMPDNGYFAAKIAQERLIEKSGIPYSLVHATQFFEFARAIADEATVDGEVHVAPVRFQPIAADDVADAVARAAVDAPLNGRVEVGGPDQYRMDEFFREALTAWGDRRRVVTDERARYFGSVPGERTLVPGGGARLGRLGYRDWLAREPAAWQKALTVVQEVQPPFIPAGAHAMTVVVEHPPGSPGTPPHRHSGPAFGYVIEGAMRFELEGDPERVLRAGEAFWEPGGDVIHYQDGNARDDVPLRFTVTMLCEPDRPMLVLVEEEELARRRHLRAPRPS